MPTYSLAWWTSAQRPASGSLCSSQSSGSSSWGTPSGPRTLATEPVQRWNCYSPLELQQSSTSHGSCASSRYNTLKLVGFWAQHRFAPALSSWEWTGPTVSASTSSRWSSWAVPTHILCTLSTRPVNSVKSSRLGTTARPHGSESRDVSPSHSSASCSSSFSALFLPHSLIDQSPMLSLTEGWRSCNLSTPGSTSVSSTLPTSLYGSSCPWTSSYTAHSTRSLDELWS